MPDNTDIIFKHYPPTVIMLMPSAKGNGGAYFEATCTECPDRGLHCVAFGTDHNCFNRDEDGWILQYDKEKMELKAMLIAMNGDSLLNKWEVSRRDGAGS